MNDNSVFQKMARGSLALGKAAVEVVPAVAGAVVGGPAGAAVGAKIGHGLTHLGQKSFQPSSASSLAEARAQDKTRMQQQYTMDPSTTPVLD